MKSIRDYSLVLWASPLSERAEGASARPRTALEYVRRRFKETYERKPEKPS